MLQFTRPILAIGLLFLSFGCIAQKNNFDYRILRCAEGCRTQKQNNFYRFISHINNPVCLLGPAAVSVAGLARHNPLETRKGLVGFESISSAEIIAFTLKFSVGRIRPFKYDTTFTSVMNAKNKAFPSGHTTEAFAFATAMSLAVRKWYVVIPAYAWASIIAYARVYLGVHYPTDVIAGAFLGAGSTFLVYELNKKLHQPDAGLHPQNELFGVVSGIGTAYIIYKVNDWLTKKKHHKGHP